MARKKFNTISVYSGPLRNTKRAPERWLYPPTIKIVKFPVNQYRLREVDFSKYYGEGVDEITFSLQQVFMILNEEELHSIKTLRSYFDNGIARFIKFCISKRKKLNRDILFVDVNKELILEYVESLRPKFPKEQNLLVIFKSIKSILRKMVAFQWLNGDVIPSLSKRKNSLNGGYKLYSANEWKCVVRTIKESVKEILDGTEPYTSEQLCILAAAISIRTGLNPTPLVNLRVDCLKPHIKRDRYILESFKRRSNSVQHSHLKKLSIDSDFDVATNDISIIVNSILIRNYSVRIRSENTKYSLFSFSHMGLRNGAVTTLSAGGLCTSLKKFSTKKRLRADDGKQLSISISRIRKTFINKAWEISGNNPLVASKIGNHSLKVMTDYYLEPPPESERKFTMLGEVLTEELKEGDLNKVSEPTPVSRCSDPIAGQFAPNKKGALCSNFLACVRCRSFVVTKDDLYRLFSFYWQVVRTRRKVGSKKWNRYFSHIVRVIDKEIAPKFPIEIITEQKQIAKESPHPFWKN